MEGRKLQTELYLEEITDRIEEADNRCRLMHSWTDPLPLSSFLLKQEMDIATQIEEGDVSMH